MNVSFSHASVMSQMFINRNYRARIGRTIPLRPATAFTERARRLFISRADLVMLTKHAEESKVKCHSRGWKA